MTKEERSRQKQVYAMSPKGREVSRLASQKYGKSEKGRVSRARGTKKYSDSDHGKFMLARKYAEYHGHKWEINENEYKKLRQGCCNYCGNGLPPYGVALDRVDSSGHYTMDNVVPCCTVCNKVKGNWWSAEETRIAVQSVLAFRLSRRAANYGLQISTSTN